VIVSVIVDSRRATPGIRGRGGQPHPANRYGGSQGGANDVGWARIMCVGGVMCFGSGGVKSPGYAGHSG